MAPSILGLASAILGIPTITTFIQNLISALTRNSEYIENVQCTRNQLQKFEDEDLLGKMSILLTPTGYSDGSLNTIIPPYQVLPTELVTNGTFDTDSDWSKSTGWSIGNGLATYDGTGGTSSLVQANIPIQLGKLCKITIDVITNTGSGANTIFLGGTVLSQINLAVGSYTFYGSFTNNTNFYIYGRSGQVFEIDNVSIKEIQEADFDFSRGSSATRVNEQGLVEDVQILSGELVQNGNFEQIGAEEVTNGNFETDSDWTKQTGWSISGGRAIANSTNGSLYQANDFVSGKIYRIIFQITSYESGGLICRFNNDETNIFNSIGTHTLYFQSDNSFDYVYFLGDNSFTGSIDNVSVKEVGQNWSFYNSSSNTNTRFEDNAAVLDASANQFTRFISSSSPMTIGNLYRVTYEVIETDNTTISIQYPLTYIESSLGVHTVDIVATNTNIGFSKNTVGVVKIDNVSVKEVTNDTDLPRIDYSPYSGAGTCGHILLEPQRTNTLVYSEDYSQSNWTKSQITTTANSIVSPDGSVNASLITITGNIPYLGQFQTLTSSTTYTISAFVKKGTNRWVRLAYVSSSANAAWFDLENNVVGSQSGYSTSASIENYGNGWYRITNTFSSHSSSGTAFLGLSDADNATQAPSGIGNTVYVWGFQVTQGDYPTSYIPTESASVTRSADVANNSGNADLFNDSEGVLYAQFTALADDNTSRTVSINNTSSNRVFLSLRATTGQVNSGVVVGGVLQGSAMFDTVSQTSDIKLAIKYKQNDFSLFVNGTQAFTSSGNVFPSGTLNNLSFDSGSGAEDFYGKVKCVAVFKEALSNDDLELLTGEGYNSFAALAAAYNYNVI